MRMTTAAICTALTAHLLAGRHAGAVPATAALTRVGAAGLCGEVEALASNLGRMAAVSEAVCEPWYVALSSDLLP